MQPTPQRLRGRHYELHKTAIKIHHIHKQHNKGVSPGVRTTEPGHYFKKNILY